MAKPFETTIKRARFDVSGYEPIRMIEIADKLGQSIIGRISSGQDVHDAPAPALKEGYAKWKARKHPPAIRNWQFTGRTLRSMKTLTASDNRAVIGFIDAESNKRAAINNRRARQFGVSPLNQADLSRAVHEAGSPVKLRTI
jgi:hypothetical protein